MGVIFLRFSTRLASKMGLKSRLGPKLPKTHDFDRFRDDFEACWGHFGSILESFFWKAGRKVLWQW